MIDKGKKKTSPKKYSILQTIVFIIAAIILCPMLMFRGLVGESNDPVERITTHFEITLDEASDLHYRATFGIKMKLRTLVRYTVPSNLVDSSISTTYHDCLLVERVPNFMPEFAHLSGVEWWTPELASDFEGATCIDDESELTITYHILVDYGDDEMATVYFEQE